MPTTSSSPLTTWLSYTIRLELTSFFVVPMWQCSGAAWLIFRVNQQMVGKKFLTPQRKSYGEKWQISQLSSNLGGRTNTVTWALHRHFKKTQIQESLRPLLRGLFNGGTLTIQASYRGSPEQRILCRFWSNWQQGTQFKIGSAAGILNLAQRIPHNPLT